MSAMTTLEREIAIIKVARLLRTIAKEQKDGDGDGKRALYPGGPDNVPVTPKAVKAAARTVVRSTAKPAKKAPAKKAAAKKAPAKKVTAPKKAAPKTQAPKVSPKAAAPKASAKKAAPPKKAAPTKTPAKRPSMAESIPGRLPEDERVDQRTFAQAKKNPLFRPLFGPLPPDPEPGEPDSYETFKSRHYQRVIRRKTIKGDMKAGGKTSFVRFIPANHKRGRTEVPNGRYESGLGMELNEVGAMGEALIVWNPQVRKMVENYFGAPIDHAEGQTLEGRVSNSTFDLFAGEYAIEVKTLNISSNKDKYKMGNVRAVNKKTGKVYKNLKQALEAGENRKNLELVHDPSTMKYKVDQAQKRGMKPALLIIMVDQDSGRVWLMAETNIANLNDSNHHYQRMEFVNDGGGAGLHVGQDALYSAWAFGLLKRPIRTIEGDQSWGYDKKKKKVVIRGGPSQKYGSEMQKLTIQQMLDQGYTSDGFL